MLLAAVYHKLPSAFLSFCFHPAPPLPILTSPLLFLLNLLWISSNSSLPPFLHPLTHFLCHIPERIKMILYHKKHKARQRGVCVWGGRRGGLIYFLGQCRNPVTSGATFESVFHLFPFNSTHKVEIQEWSMHGLFLNVWHHYSFSYNALKLTMNSINMTTNNNE